MDDAVLDRKMAPLATTHCYDESITPKSNRMPLTEYSANISPVREKSKPQTAVPPDYLLADGYPDVSDKFHGDSVNTYS